MSRRGAGIALIAAAAFLHATRYVCAAIFGSGVSSWSSTLFVSMLRNVGSSLTSLAVVSLVAGVAYLVWAELERPRT